MRHPSPTHTARKRPVAVTVVSLITLVAATASIIIVLQALGQGGLWEQAQQEPLLTDWRFTETGEEFLRALWLLISGLVTFVMSIGLLGIKRWAWVGLMAWTGTNLAVNLVRYWYGRPEYLALLFGVVVVFSLNLAEAQEAFGIRRHADETHAAND